MKVFDVERVLTYITELDQTKLSQGVDDLPSNFIRYVQLDHAHVRRAEHGSLVWSHDGRYGSEAASVDKMLVVVDEC